MAVYLDFFGLGAASCSQLNTCSAVAPYLDMFSWDFTFTKPLAEPEGALDAGNWIVLVNGGPVFPPAFDSSFLLDPTSLIIVPMWLEPITPGDIWSFEYLGGDPFLNDLATGQPIAPFGPVIYHVPL